MKGYLIQEKTVTRHWEQEKGDSSKCRGFSRPLTLSWGRDSFIDVYISTSWSLITVKEKYANQESETGISRKLRNTEFNRVNTV